MGGLGFPTPKAAIKGNYVDKKCPFTSNVSIRGRILKGLVLSTKMKNTVVIRRDYLHWITKYKRYEKRHKNMSVHVSPAFENVGEGDILTVGQCRPLSKTVRFNALAHEPAINQSVSVKKQFRIFLKTFVIPFSVFFCVCILVLCSTSSSREEAEGDESRWRKTGSNRNGSWRKDVVERTSEKDS